MQIEVRYSVYFHSNDLVSYYLPLLLNFLAVSESRTDALSYWIILITWLHFLEFDRMSESRRPPTENESIFRCRFIAFIVIAPRLRCHSTGFKFLHFLLSYVLSLLYGTSSIECKKGVSFFYFCFTSFFLTLSLIFCSIF